MPNSKEKNVLASYSLPYEQLGPTAARDVILMKKSSVHGPSARCSSNLCPSAALEVDRTTLV